MIKKAELVFRILCFLFLAVMAFKLLEYHYQLIVYPFPNEYREGAQMTTTDDLVKGLDPFALKSQPQHMNDYGVFYSLVTWPFAKIFGTTLLVHRAVTAFFIFACGGLMFWVMRRRKADLFLSCVAVVLFYAFSLYPGTTTPLVNPSSLGLFIFLSALFIPWSRGFSFPSLLVSAALAVPAFYTKPYYILCVPMLAIYLFLFVSKRRSVAYFLVFTVLAAISVVIANHLWECYFANCFFLHLNPGHMSWKQSIKQFWHFVRLNNVVLYASAAALTVHFFLIRGEWFKRIREFKPFSFLLYCTVFSLAVLFFFLGKHEQAYLWYYFHLLSPFLLVCMAVALTRQLPWALVFYPFLLWNIWSVSAGFNSAVFDRNDEDWQKVEQLIAAHKDVMNSPLIAPLLVEHDRPVYDNGLSEYFKMGGYRDSALGRMISKGDARIILRYYKFMSEMRRKIEAREFDLVLIAYNYAPMVPGELKDHYRLLGAVTLKAPAISGSWPITIWVPNDR